MGVVLLFFTFLLRIDMHICCGKAVDSPLSKSSICSKTCAMRLRMTVRSPSNAGELLRSQSKYSGLEARIHRACSEIISMLSMMTCHGQALILTDTCIIYVLGNSYKH